MLSDLPWMNIKNATQIAVLDLRGNRFVNFVPVLTQMVERNVNVYFEGI